MKPCPFCGNENVEVQKLVSSFWVECQNEDCWANGPLSDSEEEAIERWQKRWREGKKVNIYETKKEEK